MILLLVILLLVMLLSNNLNEGFYGLPTRSTRNMSYDLRGDPCIIRPGHFLWNNASAFDYYLDRPFCDEIY